MKTKPVEFSSPPIVSSHHWTSDCGRYRIIFDQQLHRPYRALRKFQKGSGFLGLSVHETRDQAIAACREHAAKPKELR